MAEMTLRVCVAVACLGFCFATTPTVHARKSRALVERKVVAPKRCKKKRCGSRPPARLSKAYIKMRAQWHHAPSKQERAEYAAFANQPLVLKPIYRDQSYILNPMMPSQTFDASSLDIASHVFCPDEATLVEIDPRLLALLYQLQREFDVPYVRLISGFRDTRETSRHFQGRAADIVLPGVSDRKLAKRLQREHGVGVGLYPNSGFVHVDVRDANYYWVDYSLPGSKQRPRALSKTKLFGKRLEADEDSSHAGDVGRAIPSKASP